MQLLPQFEFKIKTFTILNKQRVEFKTDSC